MRLPKFNGNCTVYVLLLPCNDWILFNKIFKKAPEQSLNN